MSARGCLLSIGVFVAIVVGILWFALPPIIGGLAVGALTNAGFHGTDTHVDVASDPPLRLLFLDADRIHVRSNDASIRNVRADSVDVTLRDVSIGNRQFGFIEGALEGVVVTTDQGPAFEARSVQVTGPAEAAHAAISLDKASVQNLVSSALALQTGRRLTAMTLASPDRVTLTTDRGSMSGRLQVTPGGELVLMPTTGGSYSIVGTGDNQPIRLDSVQVSPDGVELGGFLDLRE